MTKDEFKKWTTLTASSKTWVMDQIRWANNKEILFYTGGDDGKFIWIYKHGKLQTGNYVGAIPHIMDATFYPNFIKQFPNREEAYKRVIECGGVQFSLNTLCGVA